MRVLKWSELSPIAQDNARSKDSDPNIEQALFVNWWSEPMVEGGAHLLHEDGGQRIQVIVWKNAKKFYLVRLHSNRLIARIDFDDINFKAGFNANPSEWAKPLFEWVAYWDNFDREQTALALAEKAGMPAANKEKVRYEAKRIDGWFLRYRRSDDIYEFTKRKDDGLVYFYTGEYFLGLPQPPVASESNDSGSAHPEAWEA